MFVKVHCTVPMLSYKKYLCVLKVFREKLLNFYIACDKM